MPSGGTANIADRLFGWRPRRRVGGGQLKGEKAQDILRAGRADQDKVIAGAAIQGICATIADQSVIASAGAQAIRASATIK